MPASAATGFRQLYVNGERARRARGLQNPAGFAGSPKALHDKHVHGGMERSGEHGARLSWKVDDEPLQDHIHQRRGDLFEKSMLEEQPVGVKVGSKYQSSPLGQNAYELLGSPGEWYLDRGSGYLYTKPRSGEDMRNAEVIAPALQDMIITEGAHDIEFRNLTFAHSTWAGPDNGNDGYVGLQSGYHKVGILGALVRMHSPIHFAASKNIAFEGNLFTQLGSKALVL